MNCNPFVSIIIPAHNASRDLARCLDAIAKSSFTFYEIIVVDDGSTDNTAGIGRQTGVQVFRLQNQQGPAAARNYGSQKAKGDILLYVDADVMIRPETVERLVQNFNRNGDTAAVFGSYDDSPAAQNLVSQYKNLQHHFVHQYSNRDAVTFWAGCGAIRREVFHKVGGFDQDRYRNPSIEDIELGHRMKRLGYRILLDRDLQVKHLKQWKLASLLRTDIFYRAVPWSKLIIKNGDRMNDLNLHISAKLSAILLFLMVGLLPLTVSRPKLLYLIPIILGLIIILNYRFYKFLKNKNGLRFTILSFPLHLFYYFYSGAIFILYRIKQIFSNKAETV